MSVKGWHINAEVTLRTMPDVVVQRCLSGSSNPFCLSGSGCCQASSTVSHTLLLLVLLFVLRTAPLPRKAFRMASPLPKRTQRSYLFFAHTFGLHRQTAVEGWRWDLQRVHTPEPDLDPDPDPYPNLHLDLNLESAEAGRQLLNSYQLGVPWLRVADTASRGFENGCPGRLLAKGRTKQWVKPNRIVENRCVVPDLSFSRPASVAGPQAK